MTSNAPAIRRGHFLTFNTLRALLRAAYKRAIIAAEVIDREPEGTYARVKAVFL